MLTIKVLDVSLCRSFQVLMKAVLQKGYWAGWTSHMRECKFVYYSPSQTNMLI
jgi:hypothetical protein